MARKTILCHFYNEEWILPHWLRHHREIFDHGIMIDYQSNDRSCDIIRELCPSWTIHPSRNTTFDPNAVDAEVAELEAPLEGWRTTLNAPEFLIGNYDHLNDRTDQMRIYAAQYMFADMERREEPYYLIPEIPLYKQRWWGFGPVTDFANNYQYGTPPRAPRSIHNYNAGYPVVGRHFPGNPQTYSDLAIFYYGYASLEEGSIKRKMQIQTRTSNPLAHQHDFNQLMQRFKKDLQPRSRDMREEIKPIISAHESWLYRKTNPSTPAINPDHIKSAIATLNTALGIQ